MNIPIGLLPHSVQNDEIYFRNFKDTWTFIKTMQEPLSNTNTDNFFEGNNVQTTSGNLSVNNELHDSVIVGDVNNNISVTNKIILQPSLQSSLIEKGLYDSFSAFFGGAIEIDEREDLSDLIVEMEKRYHARLKEEEGKDSYSWQSGVLWDIENDLKTIKFLRFGHSYDSRTIASAYGPAFAINAVYGNYIKTQLVGYDSSKKFVIIWIEKYKANKNPLLKRLFRGKYDWYGPPLIQPEIRSLCTVSVDDFFEIYSTIRVHIRRFLPWRIERYEILSEPIEYIRF